ncbi:MAG TPA: NADH-quinone oxidoreductase subunit N, partial [Parasulfuritortus sp.]
MNGVLTGVDYIRILPELVLSLFGILIMLIESVLGPKTDRRNLGRLGFVGALCAIGATIVQAGYQGVSFNGMVHVDGFSIFFHLVVILVAAVVTLASFEYLNSQQIQAGEYYALILFGTVGMCLMSAAVELVLIFIAIEISSISTYVLAGLRRNVPACVESSIKYFLLGSFATAFFLYGVALMFGATGSTYVYAIGAALHSGHPSGLAFAAIALMLVGLGFKVAAAPFHVWTPDVYEGAPSPVVALMSTGPKAATFAVMLRILFGANAPGWFWLIWVSAVLSMFMGNLGALVQHNIKRMLAYSSIAHAGYLLVAFAAAPQIGVS